MAKIIPFPLQKRIFQPYSGFYGYSSYLTPYYAKKMAGKVQKKNKPGKLIQLAQARESKNAQLQEMGGLSREAAESKD